MGKHRKSQSGYANGSTGKYSAGTALDRRDPIIWIQEKHRERMAHSRDELPDSKVVDEVIRGWRRCARGRSGRVYPSKVK